MEKERLVYPDILRVATIFAVIILHVSGSNWANCAVSSKEWQVFNFYDAAVRWCVPVFVMLSGMFMLDPEKHITLKQLYLKNILRIFTALLFWGTLYPFLNNYILYKNTDFTLLYKGFKAVLTGNSWYHLWFLYMIIGLYAITPILRVFIKNSSRNDLRYFLLLSFLFAGLLPLLLKYHPFSKFEQAVSNLRINMFTGYAGYYVLGYYVRKFDFKKSVNALVYVLGIVGIAFTICATSYISLKSGAASAIFYTYTFPNVIFASLAVVLSFKRLFSGRTYGKRFASFFSALSKCTFGVYLFHDILNILFKRIGFTTLSPNPALSVIVISAIILIISYAASYLISKIPLVSRYIL